MRTETQSGRAANSATIYLLALGVVTSVWICLAYPDSRSRQLFQGSFLLAVATAMAAVPLGLMLAWLVGRTDVFGRRWLLPALLLGTLLPLYLHAAVWEAGFGRLGWLSFRDDTNLPLLSGWKAAFWVHVLAAIPWVILFALAYRKLVSADLEESALLDATPIRVFLHVTLVQWIPIAVFSGLWVTVWVASEMTVTDLFQVRTFAEEVYIGFALDRVGGESAVIPSVGASLSFLAVLTLLASSACLLMAPRLHVAPNREVFIFQLQAFRGPMTLVVLAAVVVTVVVPAANLITKAGTEIQISGTETIYSWKATKALRMTALSWWDFRHEIAWSLAICQLASLAASAISVTCYFFAQRSRLVGCLSLLVAAVCLAVPGPLLGIATVRAFSELTSPMGQYIYSHTIAAPCLAMMIKCLPLVMGLTWVAMRMSPSSLNDAAKNAGASTWQNLWYVVIPTRWNALLMAFLAGVVFCLGDLAASILVVPPGVTTLAISIFGMIHSGVEDRLAGLCLASTGTLFILGLGIWWICRRTMERR